MLDKLKILWDTTSRRSFAIMLKSKHRDVYDWVLSETTNEFLTFNERTHWLLNTENLICDNGNRKKFTPARQEYGFCGKPGDCKCHKAAITERSRNTTVFGSKDFLKDRKSAWTEKYGVDNPQKLQSYKDAASARNIDKAHTPEKRQEYINAGYDTVIDRLKDVVMPIFPREEYKGSSRLNVYKWECITCRKQIESHIDYGTIPRCTICNPKEISEGEKELKEFIKSLGFIIEENSRNIIPPQELDVFIKEKSIAFEYNGIYWHSDAKKDKFYHVDKYLECKKHGIHLIQIFEDEWKSKNDIIKSRIRSLLGVNKRNYARNCIIKEVDGKTTREFLNNNHLQGYVSSSNNIGLYLGNDLVGLMTFGKARFDNKNEYELLRYCSIGNIVGGPSKLFSYFIKTYTPTSIVTYADRCWSDGNLYRKLNLVDVTADKRNTGYYYVKDFVRYHRSSLTKKSLVKKGGDPASTEQEIASKMGYHKIYNCGNYKFIYNSIAQISVDS